MRLNPGRQMLMYLCAMMFVLLSLLAPDSHAQQQSVRAELSATSITRDESVILTVIAVGIDKELDISSLDKDFEVVGRSSSRQVSTVIGANNEQVVTSEVRWVLELVPRNIGVFTIPAVTVGGIPSQLLTLTVNDIPSGARRDVYVEASVDTQTPWVQSQVIMTLRVYQAIDIVDGGLDIPSGNDLVVERIGDDSSSSEIVDGRQYSVTTRKFALFAQKSGTVRIEPITLSVSVPADPSRVRGFFSPTRKLTRRTDPIVLDVKARPAAGTAWWLPARAVELESQWAGDGRDAQVDQPLTRTITLRASGVLDSQMPDINIPAIEGASLYAEEPQRGTGSNEAGLYSEQIVNWAVIPQRAGELTLPALNIEWFNTRTGQSETAILPEETIVVSAAALSRSEASTNNDATSGNGSGVGADQPQTQILSDNAQGAVETFAQQADQQSDANELVVGNTSSDARVSALERSAQLWRTGAMAAVLLWLLTGALFFFSRRKNRSTTMHDSGEHDKADALGALRAKAQDVMTRLAPLVDVKTSCQAGDPMQLRQALVDWAARQWPSNPPQTLTSLAAMLPPGEARVRVNQLDASLYSRSGSGLDSTNIMAKMVDLPELLKLAMTENRQGSTSRAQDTSSNGNYSLPEL